MKKLIHTFKSPGLVYDYAAGKITQDMFWQRVTKYLNVDKKVTQDMEKTWFNSYKIRKEMPEIIEKLRRNYKVVVVSGNLRERVEFLNKKFNLHKIFDSYFYSFDYGTNKPSADLCKFVFRKLRIDPEECVMIDDNKKYLLNVKKLRVKIIQFSNPNNLKKDLKNLSIKL